MNIINNQTKNILNLGNLSIDINEFEESIRNIDHAPYLLSTTESGIFKSLDTDSSYKYVLETNCFITQN